MSARYEIHFALSSAIQSQNLAFAQTRAGLGLPPDATNERVVAAAQSFRAVLEAIAAGNGGAAEAAAALAGA